jgi:hypothetical protein
LTGAQSGRLTASASSRFPHIVGSHGPLGTHAVLQVELLEKTTKSQAVPHRVNGTVSARDRSRIGNHGNYEQ